MIDETGILVGEPVVILAPDMRGQQVIQRSDLAPPRQVRRDLQPLRVLVEHRIDDVDERLVAVEQSMSAGEQVALEPALALVFAQHRVQHASGRCEQFVVRHGRGVPLALGRLEQGSQTVGERLVRAEDPEVSLLLVQLRDVTQERSEHTRIADAARPGRRHGLGVVAEIRHPQVAQQHAAVGVRIGAHASLAPGRKFGQFGLEAALRVEELFRPVAPQPFFQQPEVLGMRGRLERHLVRAEGAFHLQAVDDLRAGPALG